MSIKGLTEYASRFSAVQAERDKVVEKGQLAYRMGIEFRNCPEKDLSRRKLWEIGWQNAETKFIAQFPESPEAKAKAAQLRRSQ